MFVEVFCLGEEKECIMLSLIKVWYEISENMHVNSEEFNNKWLKT